MVQRNDKFNGPVLLLTEPITQTRVHLVGVAHGSVSSAALVDDVIASIRPANVVVELCQERFLSISLDARMRPRHNESWAAWYDDKLRVLEEQDAARARNVVGYSIARFISVTRFIGSQGLVAGLFVYLGLVVSSLQRLARTGPGPREAQLMAGNHNIASARGDEFVTAMRAAEEQGIEVSLGDAPQSDTLDSVKRVISPELFRPEEIIEGAQALWFSMLGVGPFHSFKRLGESMSRKQLDESEWLNIPLVYATNTRMLQGLMPLLLVAISTPLLSLALNEAGEPEFQATAQDIASASAPVSPAWATDLLASLPPVAHDFASSIVDLLSVQQLPEAVEILFDTSADLFSILVLIRLARLIGTNRDAVIAAKIQQACSLYPQKDIVVVIGMLHANGVARWLMSGKDPQKF